MAFFNGWPWTQFQEQNLDWLIRNQKKLEQQIEDLEEKIKYPDTPDVTELKNRVDLLNRNTSPIYLGDFATFNHAAQGMVVFNGILNVMVPNAYDNYGTVYRFDMPSNTKLTELNIEMGHANSVCYSPNTDYVYIIPREKYSGGVATDEWMIYRYTSDFQNLTKIPTTFLPRAITHDPVQKKIYIYGVDSKIYTFDESTMATAWYCDFNFATTYVGSDGRNYQLNQDIAVYDGFFYLAGVRGIVYTGVLEPGLSDSLYGFMMDNHDIDDKYWLIENEGWEFTEDGHLLCIYATDSGGPATDNHSWFAFLTEINVGITNPYAASGPINTLQLASFNYKASNVQMLSHYYQDLCDPCIINCLVWKPDRILIEDDYVNTVSGMTIFQDLEIQLQANMTIYAISEWNGTLTFTADAANRVLTFIRNTQPISCARGGNVAFGGTYPIIIALPNITGTNKTLVYYGFHTSTMLIVTQMPVSNESANLRIGSTNIQKGFFIGETLVSTL